MRFIGRREGVAPELLEQMRWAEETTSRQRPDHAVRGLQLRRAGGDRRRRAPLHRRRRRRSSARHLYAPEMHDPDLIIRTSGEQRLSNYLLWQSAYSELHFTRRAVAGLLARRPRVRAGRVRRPPAPLRRPLMAARSRRGGPRPPPQPGLGPRRAGRGSPSRPRSTRSPSSPRADWIFAARASSLLGIVCLHELFRMYEPLRPVKLAGFLGADRARRGRPLRRRAPGPARHRGPRSRSCSCSASRCPSGADVRSPTACRSRSLGVLWIGLAVALAVLLRDLPHGDGIVVDVLVGTFIGDTAALLGGRAFGTRRLAPRISPNKTVEGLVFGVVGATLAVWCAGLYQDWLAGWEALVLGVVVGARGAARRPVRVQCQARRGHEGRRARSSERTAARWTGSTPRSSRSSRGTTSGRRCPEAMQHDDETEHERRDRQIAELLQELRVALPGVQILFAFLLTVPFSQRFPALTAFQLDVYYVTLIATALSDRVPHRPVGLPPAALPPGRSGLGDRVREPADHLRAGVPGRRAGRIRAPGHRHPVRRPPRVDLLRRGAARHPRACGSCGRSRARRRGSPRARSPRP